MSMEAMEICNQMQHTNSGGLNTVEKEICVQDCADCDGAGHNKF